MDVMIKMMNESDLDTVIDACAEEGWNTFHLRREHFIQALQKSTLIVAYSGDTFIGFARAISDESITTFLCELLVVKEYRNQGIGKLLVQYIWDIFPQTRIELISDADAFYEKINFRKVGTGFRISQW